MGIGQVCMVAVAAVAAKRYSSSSSSSPFSLPSCYYIHAGVSLQRNVRATVYPRVGNEGGDDDEPG
jgi:hypothetical protein